MIVKAITLWQPWAMLMALGEKGYETRSWMTTYRGPLAIHAALTFPQEARALCLQEPFRSVLKEYGYLSPVELPRGVVLAVGSLVRIEPTGLLRKAMFINPNETAFGDYSDGRFAWEVVDVELLPEPIKAAGRQRLWNWEMPGEALQMRLGF